MEYTQGYGSLVIKFDDNGKSFLSPTEGCDNFKLIFHDASEFVTLYERKPMILRIQGFNITIIPNVPASVFLKDFKTQYDKIIGNKSQENNGKNFI